MTKHIPDCGYPGCTGVHNAQRWSELCPRSKAEAATRQRAHQASDRGRAMAIQKTRRWRERHPERYWASRLKARYGITLKERYELFEASDGLCALCYEHPATQIDHDHETGQVRGALCPTCNKGLWFYESRGGDVIEHYLNSVSVVTPS